MKKYNFNYPEDDVLSIRIRKDIAEIIRDIAKKEKVSIQEVCRTFLTVSTTEYLEENK